MAAATAVTAAWVFVTLGSTPAADYRRAGSTGIDLVRVVGGPVAGWLALAFVILALGVAGMISAFVLGDLAIEQIPVPRSMSLDLSEGLVLHAVDPAQGGAVVILSASGDDVSARAVRDHTSSTEPVAGSPWAPVVAMAGAHQVVVCGARNLDSSGRVGIHVSTIPDGLRPS